MSKRQSSYIPVRNKCIRCGVMMGGRWAYKQHRRFGRCMTYEEMEAHPALRWSNGAWRHWVRIPSKHDGNRSRDETSSGR